MKWDNLVQQMRQVFAAMPDRRTGENTEYTMEDFGVSAFSVFFTQSPSFLAAHTTRQEAKGRSNAQSLLQIEQIPIKCQSSLLILFLCALFS